MTVSGTATPPSVHDTLPMSVADMTFLVNRLGDDCAPLQYIRELTQNGIEAILKLDPSAGRIIWDVNWNHYALDGVFKLACIDTGVGMTGPEMVEYINKLSSSYYQQSTSGNFGVGAKIAAAPRNPHGLVYLSWKNGTGHMIHLWLDPEEKVYGLKRWPQNRGEFWTQVSPDLKPDVIEDHGTMVVLLGNSDDDNTLEPPPNTPMRSRWLLRQLNTRYFRFPKGIMVSAREGWELPQSDSRHNFLRTVLGQGEWLDQNCESKGSVELTNAKAHWWILRNEVDRDSGHFAPGGHVAAIYQDELYELLIGRAGIARLHGFGVIFGSDRVVIYLEPSTDQEAAITPNTARTLLYLGGEPLPWTEWAAEFRNRMPDALYRLQDEIGARAGETDHKKTIRERLKQIKDLLRFARFRPSRDGAHSVDLGTSNYGGQPAVLGDRASNSNNSGGKGGRAGDLYALFAEASADKGDLVESIIEPDVIWVSAQQGTRTPPDLDDRAAQFLVAQNKLMINADFLVFTDMIHRWEAAYSYVTGSGETVRDVVREWFEQQLIETIMSAMSLRRTGRWSLHELEKLWSEEALTAAVLPRWHIDQSIKRMLGHRLGKAEAA